MTCVCHNCPNAQLSHLRLCRWTAWMAMPQARATTACGRRNEALCSGQQAWEWEGLSVNSSNMSYLDSCVRYSCAGTFSRAVSECQRESSPGGRLGSLSSGVVHGDVEWSKLRRVPKNRSYADSWGSVLLCLAAHAVSATQDWSQDTEWKWWSVVWRWGSVFISAVYFKSMSVFFL